MKSEACEVDGADEAAGEAAGWLAKIGLC